MALFEPFWLFSGNLYTFFCCGSFEELPATPRLAEEFIYWLCFDLWLMPMRPPELPNLLKEELIC